MKLASADGDQASFWIAAFDTIINTLFMVICLFALQSLLPHMKASEAAKKEGISPGSMCAELYWQDGLDTDIDLWGRGPDGTIVGYRNRDGLYLDLLRDDQGATSDPMGRNYETMCSRVLKAGEWTFNAQYYHGYNDRPVDVPVTLVLTFHDDSKGAVPQKPIKMTGTLHGEGDEITVIDFELDATGHVVPASINTVLTPLRALGMDVHEH